MPAVPAHRVLDGTSIRLLAYSFWRHARRWLYTYSNVGYLVVVWHRTRKLARMFPIVFDGAVAWIWISMSANTIAGGLIMIIFWHRGKWQTQTV